MRLASTLKVLATHIKVLQSEMYNLSPGGCQDDEPQQHHPDWHVAGAFINSSKAKPPYALLANMPAQHVDVMSKPLQPWQLSTSHARCHQM